MLLSAMPDKTIGGWLQNLSPMGEWNGELILLPHIKVQEWTKYSWPYLVRIFCACLVTGYVQAIWLQFKRVLILKTGRSSYTGPRDFRRITLTSFLLKTVERLVDRYLRGWGLALMPLHPNQHAYQAGKSMEMTLHQPMVWVEKPAGFFFLGIEGAFNYTSFDSMCDALVRHGVGHTFVWWIRATLESCLATATLNDSFRRVAASRGCLQAGMFSPVLWCLIVDDLITRLNRGGVYTQGYSDDICLLSVVEFPKTVSGLMQWAMRSWCTEISLSVNPDKMELIVFTRKRNISGFFELLSFGISPDNSISVKYHG